MAKHNAGRDEAKLDSDKGIDEALNLNRLGHRGAVCPDCGSSYTGLHVGIGPGIHTCHNCQATFDPSVRTQRS